MKKSLIYISLAATLFASCEKIIEQEPQTSLDATTAFNNRQSVEAGIIGVYDAFQSASYYGVSYTLLAELGADNTSHTGSFPSYLEIKNRNITTNNVDLSNLWNQIYVVINRVNTVLAAAEGITDAAFNKPVALAELRFLRGVAYFDLLRLWGGNITGYNMTGGKGVPLRLVPTLTGADAAATARVTEAEVWTQILADLDFAVQNAPVPSTTVSVAAGRLTKNAALGMAARAELYRNNFDAAETLATQILTQYTAVARGGLAANYADVWATKNTRPESIWELQFTATDANSLRFYYYGRNEVASSAALGDAHEAGDTRKAVNYTPTAIATTFKQLKYFRPDGTDNIPLLRLAEIYLIRAEARARKAVPDIAGAQADLNIVRSRAGLEGTAAATTDAMLDAVLQERRVELAHEAHRWFDLRRTGRAATVLAIPETFRVLWPIPQRERETSGFLIDQNEGY